MKKENADIEKFVKKLMKDIGFKMSAIVVEQEHVERVDYRLMNNKTLPFFYVANNDFDFIVNVGSSRTNTRIFRFEKIEGKLDDEFYEAILPLVKRSFEKVRGDLESQIKYKGEDGVVIVREGLLKDETYLYYYTASGEKLSATRFEHGDININMFPEAYTDKFLEHVVTYLVGGK